MVHSALIDISFGGEDFVEGSVTNKCIHFLPFKYLRSEFFIYLFHTRKEFEIIVLIVHTQIDDVSSIP